MEKNMNHINDLIVGFLSKELDEKGCIEIQSWIDESPENKQYFDQQREIWFSTIDSASLSKYDKDKAFDLFKKRVLAQDENSKIKIRHRRFMLWNYAAAIIVLCIVSYFSYRGGESNIKSEFADIVVESPSGSRTQLRLPDGTKVWLNAKSRISYSQGFGVDDRKVNLSGEGYFEVKKNEKLPFSIQSADLIVRDIGTKFNVRNYPHDEEALVSLTEGKVVLNSKQRIGDFYYLSPNQRAILEKSTGKIKIETYDTSNSIQWTQGRLVFDGESVSDIAKVLERSYNVKITITDEKIKQYHFYGIFVRQEQSLKDVLDALSATGKMQYMIRGNKIIIN